MGEEESIYFEKGDIYVTASRLVIGASIYYLNTITSVKTFQTYNKKNEIDVDEVRRSKATQYGAISIGILTIALIGKMLDLEGFLNSLVGIAIVIGITGLLVAIFLYLSSTESKRITEYHLSIITAASEQQVYTTTSLDEMQSLVIAINKAKADQV